MTGERVFTERAAWAAEEATDAASAADAEAKEPRVLSAGTG
jgi:hypothetical protein